MRERAGEARLVTVVYGDVIRYSKHSLEEKKLIDDVLRSAAEAEKQRAEFLAAVDNGDGFFVVFEGDPRCAGEVALTLDAFFKEKMTARVRIGAHVGVTFVREDLRGGLNFTGPAVEFAQRVMTVADGGHPLVSDDLGRILREFGEWRGLINSPSLRRVKSGEAILVWQVGSREFDQLWAGGTAREGWMESEEPKSLSEWGLLDRLSGEYRRLVSETENGWRVFVEGCFDDLLSDEELNLWLAETSVAIPKSVKIERKCTGRVRQAIAQGESFVLVRSPVGFGKSTLLQQGAEAAVALGHQVVILDIRRIESAVLAERDLLYREILHGLFDQLGLSFHMEWDEELGSNLNFERGVVRALEETGGRIFWAWDEAERLLFQEYADDLFGLMRSWHNRRAWERGSIWERLTIGLAYRSDATQLIKNQQQSPFNVGVMIEISPFEKDDLSALNREMGNVVIQQDELSDVLFVLGGHPGLCSAALEGLARGELSVGDLKAGRIGDQSGLGRLMESLWNRLERDEVALSGWHQYELGREMSAESLNRLRLLGLWYGRPESKVISSLIESFFRERGKRIQLHD
ncbi:hypothetical protein CCB80_04555 [Armatimonadetes bacterium Uphvl-Ar1]|nr:hypothetical protein CCB80_04555 [Armatimonadetes bacterium Uphvl-Ar1]